MNCRMIVVIAVRPKTGLTKLPPDVAKSHIPRIQNTSKIIGSYLYLVSTL